MTTDTFNWYEFSHAILVDIAPDELFYYIASSEGLTKWFIGDRDFISPDNEHRDKLENTRKGDCYFWQWLNKNMELSGEILESRKNKLISFTFGSAFKVTLKIGSENCKTKLVLTQEYANGENREDFNFVNYCVCWTFFLTNLKSVAENIKDLRETDVHDEMLVNR